MASALWLRQAIKRSILWFRQCLALPAKRESSCSNRLKWALFVINAVLLEYAGWALVMIRGLASEHDGDPLLAPKISKRGLDCMRWRELHVPPCGGVLQVLYRPKTVVHQQDHAPVTRATNHAASGLNRTHQRRVSIAGIKTVDAPCFVGALANHIAQRRPRS